VSYCSRTCQKKMWAVHKKTCASRAPKAKPKPDFEGETIDLAGFDPTMLAAMTAATSAAQGALDGGNVKIAASTTTHGLQIPWAPPRMNMSKGAMLACNASAEWRVLEQGLSGHEYNARADPLTKAPWTNECNQVTGWFRSVHS
jgi:hypothetical protein